MSMIGICKARAPYRNMLSPRPSAARSCFQNPGVILAKMLKPGGSVWFVLVFLAGSVLAQAPFPQRSTFEGQLSFVLANDKLSLSIWERGGAIVDLVLKDDPEKLSPLWNPVRLARELGQTREAVGSAGHFVCVDGFGPPSTEELAAGIPMHGEAHFEKWDVVKAAKNGATTEIAFRARLPIVQEIFSRTFRIVEGENVVYVDSTLENELGGDRPVAWAEHTTIGSPFLSSGVALSSISGTRAQNRPYQGTGNPGAERRLASGKDFTWPMAQLVDGKLTDLTAPPEGAHFLDHATVLVDPALKYGWVATVQTAKRLVLGYVFRRTDYPWVQNWGNYPSSGKFSRGLEFATQPYDEPRRDAIAKNGMFGAPTFRWLPAKSAIHTSFLMFYAHTPADFGKVENVRFENGTIAIEDGAKHKITLPASLPLSDRP